MKTHLFVALGLTLAIGLFMTSCQEETDLTRVEAEVAQDQSEDVMQLKPCIPVPESQLGCDCYYRIDSSPDDVRWWLWTPNTTCCVGGETHNAVSIYNICDEDSDTNPGTGVWVPFECDVTEDQVQFAFAAFNATYCPDGDFGCRRPVKTIKLSMYCDQGIGDIGPPAAEVQFEITANIANPQLPCPQEQTGYQTVIIEPGCNASL